MRIGYCPTMKPFVEKLESRGFILVNLGSAGAVFQALNLGEIDVGVVGRRAKSREFSGFMRRLSEGYTLVNDRKQMILNEDLGRIRINTALSKEIVESKFPYLKNVVYRGKIPEKLDGGVWLISWDDWRDDFELLIPVDGEYRKNSDFRVPHVFSRTKEGLEKVLEVIKNG